MKSPSFYYNVHIKLLMGGWGEGGTMINGFVCVYHSHYCDYIGPEEVGHG